MRKTCAIILFLLILPTWTFSSEMPELTGRVNDRANLLSPDMELKIEQFLQEFEKSDSTQIAVLTVSSLDGRSLEEFTLNVAEKWGLGQKGKDNGALLLVAQEERKVRIEVGYGLEGRLTDLLAGRIIDNEIIPRFRAGKFDEGIVAGVVAMTEAVRGEYQGSGQIQREKKRNPLGFLALLLFFAPAMLTFGGRRRGHRRHGGFWIGPPGGFGGRGFGGGGGFSGGGGGFGGGGASGGW